MNRIFWAAFALFRPLEGIAIFAFAIVLEGETYVEDEYNAI